MDLAVFQFFHGLAGRSSIFDGAINFFATYLPYLLAVAAVFLIFRQGDRRQKIFSFIFTALTLLLSRGLLTEIIRFAYARPRPFEMLDFQPLFVPDTHPSFPSGHAAFFFALALAVSYFDRKWGWWFLGLALLNSLGRIAAGVHWPTDILGGIAIAAVSFLAVQRILPGPSRETN